MKKQSHTKEWIACLGLLVLACARRPASVGEAKPAAAAQATVSARASAAAVPPKAVDVTGGDGEPHIRPGSGPKELMTDSTSAYTAGLVVEADAIYVLTERVVYRVVPGKSPQQIPIDNGYAAAVTQNDLVYWSKGAIWRVPKTGGKPARVASLKHPPQSFMAAADDLAWLDMPVLDQFVIQSLDGRTVRTLFYYTGRIETATLDAGRVFFVKKEKNASWRIGSVSLHGDDIRFTEPKTGPTPAKLAAAGEVFYYDLRSGELRKLSSDLAREEVLSKDVVCSPVAVAARIYCPRVGGIFELARRAGATPTSVFPEPRPITNVAASSTFLAWLADAGPDRLSLMMIPLVASGE